MGNKLETLLKVAKRALGVGEKGFVGDAEEQLAKVKVKPTTTAAAKPEGMAIVTETRDDAWKAAQARANSSTGPRANPWDEATPMSAEHQRAAAAVEARLTPGAGGNLAPKPAAAAAPPPQAPAGMRLEADKPVKPLTKDQEFAQAKARAEGKPDPYGPVSHSTGGLSLKPAPATTKPTGDSVWAAAKARAEGGSPFSASAHSKPGEMGLQAKPDPWKEAQDRARAADQGQVSMTRLTEAQRQDQAWNSARDHVQGHSPIEMERIDTSRLGGATPVGTSAPARRPAPGGSGGPGGS